MEVQNESLGLPHEWKKGIIATRFCYYSAYQRKIFFFLSLSACSQKSVSTFAVANFVYRVIKCTLFLKDIVNLTTIPVELKILTTSEFLKLKTCSLYHENLLIQKFNDMNTQVLRYFFQPSEAISVSMV